jgi:hypothetical protein
MVVAKEEIYHEASVHTQTIFNYFLSYQVWNQLVLQICTFLQTIIHY